ncbi:MAG TPA: hypothetical protein PK843_01520 [bacterium]|nr:hypothetical protein [bacterium]HPN33167.1 hypothetical protein [bacterium]
MTNEWSRADFNLVVDAGGFSRGTDDHSALQNEYLLRAMTWLNYDAINLGYKEFQLKPSFVRKMEQSLHPPFVSANVLLAGADKPFVKPYLLKELQALPSERPLAFKKLKVAVFGLADNKMAQLFIARPGEPQMTYVEPLQAATELVPVLRKKADVVVMLYYGKNAEMNQVLNAVPGIDVAVLGGEYYLINSSSEQRKNQLAVSTPLQGKYVGILTLQLNKNKEIIGSTTKQISLDEKIVDDAKFLQLLNEFEKASRPAGASQH